MLDLSQINEIPDPKNWLMYIIPTPLKSLQKRKGNRIFDESLILNEKETL